MLKTLYIEKTPPYGITSVANSINRCVRGGGILALKGARGKYRPGEDCCMPRSLPALECDFARQAFWIGFDRPGEDGCMPWGLPVLECDFARQAF